MKAWKYAGERQFRMRLCSMRFLSCRRTPGRCSDVLQSTSRKRFCSSCETNRRTQRTTACGSRRRRSITRACAASSRACGRLACWGHRSLVGSCYRWTPKILKLRHCTRAISFSPEMSGSGKCRAREKRRGAGKLAIPTIFNENASRWLLLRRFQLPSGQPLIKFAEGEFALLAMALLAVADFLIERRKQIEGDVGGLKFVGVGVRDVVGERAEGGGARRGDGLCAARD